MPIRDLRAIASDEPLEADFCIVGSGPAGATIALELASTDARVLLVESGGLKRDVGTDALNEIENVGWPRVMDQWLVRNRMLGGTSNIDALPEQIGITIGPRPKYRTVEPRLLESSKTTRV
jgi:choline dehydrogenase-like flavoprotein